MCKNLWTLLFSKVGRKWAESGQKVGKTEKNDEKFVKNGKNWQNFV
jgi:hypothetical protein